MLITRIYAAQSNTDLNENFGLFVSKMMLMRIVVSISASQICRRFAEDLPEDLHRL